MSKNYCQLSIVTMDSVNIWGFAAVIFYVGTLIPTNFCRVFPQVKKKLIIFLSKNKRSIGLIAFALSVTHVAIYSGKIGGLNFLSLKTYQVYFTGISSLGIFTLLAFTSNNWSVKILKKNWKSLHKLTYLALLLVLAHVWMFMEHHWSLLTPIALTILSIMLIVYIMRLGVDLHKMGNKINTLKS